MDDSEIEATIKSKGLTGPRVTPEHIESRIAYEYYVIGTGLTSVATPIIEDPSEDPTVPLSCLTLCVLVLKNGFTVTGESACASPENFDAELGRRIARKKAIDKVWMLEGYLLKERLYAPAG